MKNCLVGLADGAGAVLNTTRRAPPSRLLQFGIPAIAIRAISDLSSQDLPLDMSEILTNEGKVSIPRVVGQVAMHPTALPELVKLGQQSSRAAEALAQFLERYIVFVSDRAAALENKAAAAT